MLITRTACFTVVALVLVTLKTAPAFAQTAAATPTDPDRGKIAVAAGTDFANTYMFRGFRQDDTRIITWPYGDLGLGVYSGDGGVRRVSIHVGTWNSLHPGDAGRDGPSGKLWYERNFYSALNLGFGGGVNLGTSYTAYISPNSMFSTVKEIALKVAVDDHALRGGIKPYALLAFELKTAPGLGQVDGGAKAGRYLEVGAGPGWARKALTISFPVKVGLSLGNYYELAGVDHRFGYVSAGSMVTVPLGRKSRFGMWSVRGGVEFESLGTTTRARNNDNRSEVIGSFGVGVSH
jgi:hypothetical protein